MCGFGASISDKDNTNINNILSEKLSHRGPDDSGTINTKISEKNYLCLMHRRLSIIDLSKNGRQPFEDKKFWK